MRSLVLPEYLLCTISFVLTTAWGVEGSSRGGELSWSQSSSADVTGRTSEFTGSARVRIGGQAAWPQGPHQPVCILPVQVLLAVVSFHRIKCYCAMGRMGPNSSVLEHPKR